MLYLVVDVLVYYGRLLGGADHAVVKGLGVDDGVHGKDNVGSLVNDGGCISCTYAKCGLSAGVGCLYHSGAACGKYDISLSHDKVGHFKAGNVYPRDYVLGSTCGYSSFKHYLCCGNCGLLCSRVRADDDAVACLQCDKSLEYSRRCGVGCRYDSCDDTNGLGYLLCAVSLVLCDDTAGPCIAVGVVYILGSVVVLDDLVLHYAHACFLNGKLCQRDTGFVGGCSGGKEYPVHLFL